MTTQPFPKNKVILFAEIDQQRQNRADQKKNAAPLAAIRRVRNIANGADYTVSLQVSAPYGGSYQIDVEVGGARGAEILAHAHAGQGLVLEGYLNRTIDVDRRFRDYSDELFEGITYQDMFMTVEAVRAREGTDPQATGSNIFLEGVVAEPPVFFRHPEFPEIELARVGVKTRSKAVLSEDGISQAGQPCVVTVTVPVDDEDAAYLYRRGNTVRVRGVLDRLAIRQNREQVRERLEDMETAWQEQRETIKTQGENVERTLMVEGDRYLRMKDRMERGTRTMLLAIEVTPVAGAQPATRQEALDDRERFNAEWRAARAQRRDEQKQRRRDNIAREQAAKIQVDAPPTALPSGNPSLVAPRTPRRKQADTLVAEGMPTAESALPALEPVTELAEPHTNGVSA